MSYQVLARRWRPQTFEQVVGQSHVTRTLQNAIAKERIPHAFLFSGPRGVGKTSVARILAKALNCQHGPTPTPCNQCTPCTEIKSGISVDVFEIDGASNTGVDDVRGLQESARYLPAHSRYKIYIIDEVHMLSKPAFNALLKTLEEPPAHVIFIFATTEPNRIPATIHSRCQRFDFKRLSLKDLREQISRIAGEEGAEISDRGIYLLSREADGSMRDAESLMEQVISFAGQKVSDADVVEALGVVDLGFLVSLARAVMEHSPSACLALLHEAHQQGYDHWQLHQGLLRTFRHLLVIHTCKADYPLPDIAEAEYAELKELARLVAPEDVHHLFSLLMQCEEDMRYSAQPLMVLEVALLRMASAEPVTRLSEILEQLERVEKRLGGASIPTGAPEAPPHSQRAPRPEKARQAGSGPPRKSASSPAEGSGEQMETPSREACQPPFESAPQAPGRIEQSAAEPLPGGADLWSRVVNHVVQKDSKLGSFIQNGKMTTFGGGRMEVAFDNPVILDRLTEEANRVLIENLVREVVPGLNEIRFVHMPPDESTSEAPPVIKESLAKKVTNNPTYKMIASEFETSHLIEVRPLSA